MPGSDIIGPPAGIMPPFDVLQLKEHVCYQLLNIISTEWMTIRQKMMFKEESIFYLLKY